MNRKIQTLTSCVGVSIVTIITLILNAHIVFAETCDSTERKLDTETIPVDSSTRVIEFTNVVFKNNLNRGGKANFMKNGVKIPIRDFSSPEEFSIEIGAFDSINFYFEWELNDSTLRTVDYYLEVFKNSFFRLNLLQDKTEGRNKVLKDYLGKDLYVIEIDDKDYLKPEQFEAMANAESKDFIEIKQSGMSFAVRLKKIRTRDFEKLVERLESRNKKSLDIGIEIMDTKTGHKKSHPAKLRFNEYE